MQPTLPQTTGAADMDLPAVQSMDWLFKKERIYLLAQFWQQRATLAEKEVNTLKEQLSINNLPGTTEQQSATTNAASSSPSLLTQAALLSAVAQQQQQQPLQATIPNKLTSSATHLNNNSSSNNNNNNNNNSNSNNTNNSNTNNSSVTALQNGIPTPLSPASPPLSDCGSTASSCIGGINVNNLNSTCNNNNNNSSSNNNKLLLNNNTNKMEDASSLITTLTAEMKLDQQQQQMLQNDLPTVANSPAATAAAPNKLQINNNNNNNSSTNNNNSNNNNNNNSNVNNSSSNNNSANSNRSLTPIDKEIDCTSSNNGNNNNNTNTNNNNSSSSSSLRPVSDDVAAKENEIRALIAEVTRLTALQDSHIVQIQRLEERLEAKRQHILRLEARLDKQTDFEDAKKDTSSLRSLDMSSPAVAAAAAAAAVATDAKQFQEIFLERTKALAAAQSESLNKLNSSNDDPASGIGGGNSMSNCHQDLDKASSHHENSSTASTPNLQDGRSNDEHMNGIGGGNGAGGLSSMSLSLGKSPSEDNNNTLGPMPHVPAGFLPGLPFQFQDRGHFRFAEDLQLPPGSMAGRLGESLIPKGDPMEAKLQEMLRYNMDKYANQNLDTLHISRRVRELLSVHNIGQRLFAKYILGLSQGTVSELLSKPKPWDKLTEKGRDSYRKMHAWGCDDNAVLLLKSLIPKKDLGELSAPDSGMPQYGRSEDSMSDDRIAHILSEASNLMKTPQGHNPAHHHHQQQQHHQQVQQQIQQAVQQQHQQHQQHQQQSGGHHENSGMRGLEDSHSNEDSKSPHNQCPSPLYRDSLQRRMKKYDNDDISQDKVARIYQEELAKLMSRTPRDTFPSFFFPPLFSGGMPPAANQMPDDNIRLTLETYRELAKLQQTGGAIPNFPNLPGLLALQQQALNGAQDLSVPKEKAMKINGQQNSSIDLNDPNTKDSISNEDALRHASAFSLVRPKQEPGTPAPNSANPNTPTAPSPLGNSILPPAMTPNEDFSAAASPLQRMASITNSLITQAPVTPHHSTPQRPMKAVLPPITQQQFDMFNNLNTEDIVRRVKEALSQYSISQRLFGESVLGLSQGSVSDLLARPKPWHMLTQKGREPFIRMKMFLEDDNAVHKLVASQYKIAPEKLMRTGNYSGSPQIPPGLGSKLMPMQKMMNEFKMQEPQHLMQLQATAAAMGHHIPTSQHQGMLLTPPGLPPHHAINLPTNNSDKKPMMMPVHSPQQNNAMRGMHQHMSPTVYEMAALTQDLDTQVITTKIKEALLANNIGQKIFGEAVLGLSQGSVSELLSKPKPWHMLSIKGREPFIRMQLWLSDANNVERLQAIKNERREASKRRRSTGPGTQDNSSDTSSNDTADFYTSSPGPGSVGSAGAPPNKKQRVLFSEEQKEALRLAFALDPYPNVATIEFLANELGLATRTITNWFHNHRMRLKQQVPHGTPNEPVPSRENQNGTPFDPVQFRILLNQRLLELQKERMGLSGLPLTYPPYFAANPNLAALIGRGLLPGGEPDLAALNNAFKEQMSGLDLSMSSLKRERDEEFDDVDGEADSHVSDTESLDGSEIKSDLKENPTSASLPAAILQARSSRRKPAAPQWVNPDWQDDIKAPGNIIPPLAPGAGAAAAPNSQEVIINGVCVMQQQAADYSRKVGSEETVRVEPTAVQDRFDDDAEDDVASGNEDDDARGETESQVSNKQSDSGETNENDENDADADADAADSEKQDDTETGRNSIGRRSASLNGDNHQPEIKEEDENDGAWNY